MSFLNRLTKQKTTTESIRSGLKGRTVKTPLKGKVSGYNRNEENVSQLVDLRLLSLKPKIKSVKFPVEGFDCPATCHAIQYDFNHINGIESVIANYSLDYFFVTYRTREIGFQEIIDHLIDYWGIKSNIHRIHYPVTVPVNPMILVPLTQRLLSCRFLLDLDWNDGLTGVTLYLNPDYAGYEEAQECIDKIVAEELVSMNNVTQSERDEKE